MKVHQFPRGFWDHVQPHEPPPSFTLAASSVPNHQVAAAACKRLQQPLASTKGPSNEETSSPRASFDLQSYIRPDSGPRRLSASTDENGRHGGDSRCPGQVETHPGGTRWNPTQEQIGMLEMLYKGGMRTPNAQQIEQVTEKLAKYGKIEGKNVFYWFQNHKARERQRQKRERLGQSQSPKSSHPTTVATTAFSKADNDIKTMLTMDNSKEECHSVDDVKEGVHKRRCRSWTFDHSPDLGRDEEAGNNMINNRPSHSDDEVSACRTLQLFPLHPEGKKMS